MEHTPPNGGTLTKETARRAYTALVHYYDNLSRKEKGAAVYVLREQGDIELLFQTIRNAPHVHDVYIADLCERIVSLEAEKRSKEYTLRLYHLIERSEQPPKNLRGQRRRLQKALGFV